MATNPTGQNLSRTRLLGRQPHYGRSFPWLEFLTFDMSVWKDDFMGAALQSGLYTTNTASGGTAAAIIANTVNGACRFTTGATLNGRTDMALGRHFQGQLNCAIAVNLQMSAVTSFKFEVGFADSTAPGGIVNNLATPTANTTDSACLIMDTNAYSSVYMFTVNNGGTPVATNTGFTPAASTYYWFIVALKDSNAVFYILDNTGRELFSPSVNSTTAYVSSALTSTVNLTPYIIAQTRTTTSVNLDVDKLWAWQRIAVANP